MKKVLLLAALTALGSTAAFAQVDVTITGSTAFRAITIDRSWSIFDLGSRTAITNDATTGLISMTGTATAPRIHRLNFRTFIVIVIFVSYTDLI